MVVGNYFNRRIIYMTQQEFDRAIYLTKEDFKDNHLLNSFVYVYDNRIWNKRGKDKSKEEGGNTDCYQKAKIIKIERDYICCKTFDSPGHIHECLVDVQFEDGHINKGYFPYPYSIKIL